MADAAASSSEADAVTFTAGLTITRETPLQFGAAGGPLTLNPAGAAGVTISGGGTSALLDVTGGDVTINRVDLLDGRGADGAPGLPTLGAGGGDSGRGAISVAPSGSLTIASSTVAGNVGGDGGDGRLDVVANAAGAGGGGGAGGIHNGGSLTIVSSTLVA